VPDELADVAVRTQPRTSEAEPTLQAVLERLTAIERRLAENDALSSPVIGEDAHGR
jgi:hypothetical protein